VGPGAEFGAGGIGRRGGILVFTDVEPSCADKRVQAVLGAVEVRETAAAARETVVAGGGDSFSAG